MNTEILRTLRTAINKALCEEEGHDYEWVETQPDYTQSAGMKIGVCQRCGREKHHQEVRTADEMIDKLEQ